MFCRTLYVQAFRLVAIEASGAESDADAESRATAKIVERNRIRMVFMVVVV